MDLKKFKEVLKKAKESKPRKFTQKIDLIVKIKGYDPKKEKNINLIIKLPNPPSESKVCAIVGPELLEKAKSADKVISSKKLNDIDKKEASKIAREYDYFVAQVQLMPALAKNFGRILGPLGKMPSPKRGQVLSPKANVKEVVEKLKKSVKVDSKKQTAVTTIIGTEEMKAEDMIKNLEIILDNIKKNIPSSQGAIDEVLIKTTMGAPVRLQ